MEGPPYNDINDYEQLPDDLYSDLTGIDDGGPTINYQTPVTDYQTPEMTPEDPYFDPYTDITEPDDGGPTTNFDYGPISPYGSVEEPDTTTSDPAINFPDPKKDNIFDRHNVLA